MRIHKVFKGLAAACALVGTLSLSLTCMQTRPSVESTAAEVADLVARLPEDSDAHNRLFELHRHTQSAIAGMISDPQFPIRGVVVLGASKATDPQLYEALQDIVIELADSRPDVANDAVIALAHGGKAGRLYIQELAQESSPSIDAAVAWGVEDYTSFWGRHEGLYYYEVVIAGCQSASAEARRLFKKTLAMFAEMATKDRTEVERRIGASGRAAVLQAAEAYL